MTEQKIIDEYIPFIVRDVIDKVDISELTEDEIVEMFQAFYRRVEKRKESNKRNGVSNCIAAEYQLGFYAKFKEERIENRFGLAKEGHIETIKDMLDKYGDSMETWKMIGEKIDWLWWMAREHYKMYMDNYSQ